MADVHSVEIRSYNMSKIRAKNTKPELTVRSYLHKNGFRYRLHVKHLTGKPDIVLPKHKTVIFINGCFWHGHTDCKYFVIPKTRTEWWLNKIHSNVLKDNQVSVTLKKEGWRVIIIWECELKSANLNSTLETLVNTIRAL